MRNRESKNMRNMTTSAVAFLVAWCFAMPISWAQPHDDKERAELAKALKSVKTPLQQGLKASAKEGTPISAKYEVEHDKLSRKLETSNDRYWSASREPQRSMTSRGYDPRQSPGPGYKRVVSCKDSFHGTDVLAVSEHGAPGRRPNIHAQCVGRQTEDGLDTLPTRAAEADRSTLIADIRSRPLETSQPSRARAKNERSESETIERRAASENPLRATTINDFAKLGTALGGRPTIVERLPRPEHATPSVSEWMPRTPPTSRSPSTSTSPMGGARSRSRWPESSRSGACCPGLTRHPADEHRPSSRTPARRPRRYARDD